MLIFTNRMTVAYRWRQTEGCFVAKRGKFKITQTVQYHLTLVDDDNLYAVQ